MQSVFGAYGVMNKQSFFRVDACLCVSVLQNGNSLTGSTAGHALLVKLYISIYSWDALLTILSQTHPDYIYSAGFTFSLNYNQCPIKSETRMLGASGNVFKDEQTNITVFRLCTTLVLPIPLDFADSLIGVQLGSVKLMHGLERHTSVNERPHSWNCLCRNKLTAELKDCSLLQTLAHFSISLKKIH